MIPAHAATQNVVRERDVEVVQRVGGAALADARTRRQRRARRPAPRESASVPAFGDRGEVDRQDQRADQDDREDAAEVVDRLGRLVDVGGDEHERHDQGDADQGQGDEEDRAPPEVLEEGPGDERPERGDAAPSADQSAIDFVRPGPPRAR